METSAAKAKTHAQASRERRDIVSGEVKTVEDLAGLVPDDLRGWFESKNGERVREPGILEAFSLDPADAELLIMRARVAMGWVEAPEEPEVVEEDLEPTEEPFAEAELAGEAQDT